MKTNRTETRRNADKASRTVGTWLFAALAVGGVVVACGGDDDVVDPGATTPTSDSGPGGAGGCAAGTTTCGGGCVRTDVDVANCGACGKACAAGEVCAKGTCTASCPTDQTRCDVGGKPVCATLATNREHCGACNQACADGEVCSNGTCALTCQQGYTACDGRPFVPPPADAGPRDAASDAADAASDAALEAGPDAAPVPPAEGGTTNVRPYCAALQTDDDNCGACGKSCAFGEKCSGGACCREGFAGCGGACVQVRNDEANCGACGNRCAQGQFCWSARCNASCPPGTTETNGACTGTTAIVDANLTNLADASCGNGNRYNGCTGTPWGFTWTDTTNVAPATLRLDGAYAIFCSTSPGNQGEADVDVTLNGRAVGVVRMGPNDCTCGATREAKSLTVPASALDAFIVGGTNEVRFQSTQMLCGGLQTNPDWTNAYARVVAEY